MSKCDFSINFKGSAEELISKAKKGITGIGGKFEGDANSGSFAIPLPVGKDIAGTYSIESSVINIDITDKSMLVTCNRIEKELNKYLSGADMENV